LTEKDSRLVQKWFF